MNFNLQEFLGDMRTEQNANHTKLETKVDLALATLQDHETRLVVVENTRKSIRWFSAALIVALLTAAVDLVFSHFPNLLKP